MKGTKRMKRGLQPECEGWGVAEHPPDNINTKEKAGRCSFCGAKVGIYLNDANVWVSERHRNRADSLPTGWLAERRLANLGRPHPEPATRNGK
jgi:hypothetical protein